MHHQQILLVQQELTNKDNIIQCLLTQLSKQTDIIRKQHYQSQRSEIRDPNLKAILKYRKYPSMLAIERKTKIGSVFTFNHIT